MTKTVRYQNCSATAGFTMIELLVCLAVIGIVATVAAPRLLDLNGQRLRTAARTLSADLRLLRSQAIRQQHPTSLSVSKQGYALLARNQSWTCFEGVALAMRPTLPSLLGPTSGRIDFFPDGSSSGGTVLLFRSSAVMAVTVSWSDGSVRINE